MSFPRLDAGEFTAFFEAVHGVKPFPWQRRLAEHVLMGRHEDGRWPTALDVPTGGGKTAAIDVAVFHLALEAGSAVRTAPVRILFVVDRRLVVDDAHRRACAIAEKLRDAAALPPDHVLHRVAARLATLGESSSSPLAVARLRGGMPKEPDWVRTPSQPAVVVSTVDQVGSRLLFRGYGIRDTMKPVHAGLLGCDTLLLLDEAHLSQPFLQTLHAIRRLHDKWPSIGVPSLTVVTLSATQSAAAPFGTSEADSTHPVLGPRLRASKPAKLVKVDADANSDEFVQRIVSQALEVSQWGGGTASAIGVVVNRVARARRVRTLLEESVRKLAGDDAPAVELLIGRSRPVDRTDVVQRVLLKVAAQRDRSAQSDVFVVATQCIEVGADLDFDALVTEIAPLDALRQRFGRLNRTGRDIDAQGVVIAARDQVGTRPDPIYETTLRATWQVLQKHQTRVGRGKKARAVIDFGVEASRGWLPEGAELEQCLVRTKDAPVVLPVFAELWSETSPVPTVDPEVSLFLHGPEAGPADVAVVWRADLPADMFKGLRGEQLEAAVRALRERIAACPPSSLESMQIPIAEARRWLEGGLPGDVTDLELSEERPETRSLGRSPWVLRWRGLDEDTRLIRSHELRPGDVIIVPAQRGGADQWGWAPTEGAPVEDHARRANEEQRRRIIVRLHRDVLALELRRELGEIPAAEIDARVRGIDACWRS
jgi:CRISPR-associated endonuclease/helicase Cas3